MGRHCRAADILIWSRRPPFSPLLPFLLFIPHATTCLPALLSTRFLCVHRRIVFPVSPCLVSLVAPCARRLPSVLVPVLVSLAASAIQSPAVLGSRSCPRLAHRASRSLAGCLRSPSPAVGPLPPSRYRESSQPCPLQTRSALLLRTHWNWLQDETWPQNVSLSSRT